MTEQLEALQALKQTVTTAAQRNRDDFPFAAEWVDTLRAEGFTKARVIYAHNFKTGKKVGRPDLGID